MPKDNESWRDTEDCEVQEMMHNETKENEDTIRLSEKDQLRFAELLLNPPELSPAMIRAGKAHKQLIRESWLSVAPKTNRKI